MDTISLDDHRVARRNFMILRVYIKKTYDRSENFRRSKTYFPLAKNFLVSQDSEMKPATRGQTNRGSMRIFLQLIHFYVELFSDRYILIDCKYVFSHQYFCD